MKESTSTALSAIGTAMLFAVAICSFFVADYASNASSLLTKVTYRFDTSKPYQDLSAQEKKERKYQVIINSISDRVGEMDFALRKKNIVDAVVESPSLSFFGFVGTALLVLSTIMDWSRKRAEERKADPPSEPTHFARGCAAKPRSGNVGV